MFLWIVESFSRTSFGSWTEILQRATNLANLKHLLVGDFVLPMKLAFLFLFSHIIGILIVLSRSNILQIFESSIARYCVFMMSDFSFWCWTDKCKQDKSVDHESFPFSILAKFYARISSLDYIALKKATCAFIYSRDSSHSSKVADFIDSFVARYCFPVFHSSIIPQLGGKRT